MTDNKIHVVLAVYDPHGTYSRHAGVVMASMFSNTKSQVCVHLLHDESLNEDNKRKLIELTNKFGQELDLIDVSEHIEKLRARVNMEKLTGGYSRGSLFRLFIQDLLPVDRVIYLDCDIVVELDIKELWDTDLGECKVGAVFDEIVRNVDDRRGRRVFLYRYAGIDVNKYFNSGVIFFNLKKIRGNMDICALALEFFQRYPYTMYPDQDFLNKHFQENMYEIGREFNYFGSGIDYSNTKGKLWHFAGEKPWNMISSLPIDTLYWRYFATTPWCDDLVTNMAKAWSESRYIHSRSSDCAKKVWLKLKENFSPRKVTPLYKIAVILYDIIYRIRVKLKRMKT